jgi:hypothetical protein
MPELPGSLGAIVRSLIIQSPLFLVWLVGAVVALVRLPKHAAVSVLLLIGFALMFLGSIGSAVAYAWLPRLMAARHGGVEHAQLIYGAVGFANCLLHAVGWVLVLVAVFGWRPRPGRQSPTTDGSSPFSA